MIVTIFEDRLTAGPASRSLEDRPRLLHCKRQAAKTGLDRLRLEIVDEWRLAVAWVSDCVWVSAHPHESLADSWRAISVGELSMLRL